MAMKRIFLFLLALGMFGVAQAQVGLMRSSGVYSVKKVSQDLGPMTKNGNIYYYHGTPMKQADMVRFLNENCVEAYNYYRKQHKIEMAGWGIFGGGLAVCLGVGVPILAVRYNVPEEQKDMYMGTGIGLICFGAVSSVCIGVPMIIAGNVQKKNAHKVYNTWCGYKELEENQAKATPLELKLISGSNGLGLALAF